MNTKRSLCFEIRAEIRPRKATNLCPNCDRWPTEAVLGYCKFAYKSFKISNFALSPEIGTTWYQSPQDFNFCMVVPSGSEPRGPLFNAEIELSCIRNAQFASESMPNSDPEKLPVYAQTATIGQ